MEVDAKGLCDIIKACHKSGVHSLKFGDVEVTFDSEPQVVNNVAHETPIVDHVPLQQGQVSMELTTDQQAIMDEAEEADMMITRPEAWEREMIDRLVYKDRTLDERRRVE